MLGNVRATHWAASTSAFPCHFGILDVPSIRSNIFSFWFLLTRPFGLMVVQVLILGAPGLSTL